MTSVNRNKLANQIIFFGIGRGFCARCPSKIGQNKVGTDENSSCEALSQDFSKIKIRANFC